MAEPRHTRIVLAFCVAAVLLRGAAILYPVLGEQEAADATVAAAVASGSELYRDVEMPEPPLGVWMAAGVDGLLGAFSNRAVHLLALLAVLATMAVLAYASRALQRARAPLMAALFFAVFSVAHPPPALGASAAIWMMLCSSVVAWLVLGGITTGRYGVLFLAGAVAAVSALLRLEGLAVAFAALTYLVLLRPMLAGREHLRMGVLGAVSFLLGTGIALTLALGYLQNRGTVGDFTRGLWSSGWAPGAGRAAVHVVVALTGSTLLWFFAGREARGLVRARSVGANLGEPGAATSFLVLWLLAAAVAAIFRGRFGSADLLGLTPPLVLLGAGGAVTLADSFWEGRWARVFRLGVAVPAALFFVAGLFHEPLYRQLGLRTARLIPIAEVVRARSDADDRIWVLGELRRLYVYTKRLPPAPVLKAGLFSRPARLSPELLRQPPTLIVDAGGPREPAVARWLAATYELHQVIEGVRVLQRRRKPR